jgi:biopolymer transport protein ExbD
MRVKKPDSGEELGVQMAPLIDCVFLLLVYFLCTSHVTKQHKDLGIDLPEAASAKETKSTYKTLIIEVTRDGTIYVESQPMTKRLLHQRLREAVIESPNRPVRIDADRSTAYAYISPLLDLLQFMGMNDVGLRIRDRGRT